VSIAIRAWRRDWLREAVASVLAQTHRDLELVICDPAGTLEDVARDARDDRIRYCRPPLCDNASARFRSAVALCRGRYIGVLDDDDRYEPVFVARLVDALENDAECGVAFCRTTWECGGRRTAPADARPEGRQPDIASDMLARGWTVSPSHMLVRRTALDAAERAQAMPDGVAPDTFLNLTIALAGWRHVLVDARLVVCRWHDGQLSRKFPGGPDTAVATWRALDLQDPRLAALRDRRLAGALLVRSVLRLRAGQAVGAREDLREAARACPTAWPRQRRLLELAAAAGPLGRTAAAAWLAWSPRSRRRRRPPDAIGRTDL
jgi:glycosyltransferase involved in cell wall biosynthesis